MGATTINHCDKDMSDPVDNMPREKEARPLFRVGAGFLALCSLFTVAAASIGDRSAVEWGMIAACAPFGLGMGFITVTGRYPPIL